MFNNEKCGWAGSIVEFNRTETEDIVQALIQLYVNHYNEHTSQIQPQIRAWYDSLMYLKSCLKDYPFPDDLIIFEYILPRSGLSRPDVIIIQQRETITIKVIEFKSHPHLAENEKWQLRLYVQKLSYYHDFSHQHVNYIQGILISTHPKWDDTSRMDDEHAIIIVGRTHLLDTLTSPPLLPSELPSSPITSVVDDSQADNISTAANYAQKVIAADPKEILEMFLASEYRPSPAIVHSAQILFRKRKIPRISTVESSNFYEVLAQVESIVAQAQQQKTHHLILVHGEPGSGKTFLGLEVAHTDYSKHSNPGAAVFLSGNRPLVDVLASLTNDTFVQHLYKFKNEYKPKPNNRTQTPYENILIFDEAQRAWDANKVNHTFNQLAMSEPDIILDIASRSRQGWSVVVALIGQGQEIKGGEEAGLDLWSQAIRQVIYNKGINYHVHGAQMDVSHFQRNTPAQMYLDTSQQLYLNSALRNHDAHQYHNFINCFLDGNFAQAADYFNQIRAKYLFRWTDDMAAAKTTLTDYANNIKTEDGRFQYGALYSTTSTKPRHFKVFGFKTTFYKVPDYVIYHNYRELRGLHRNKNEAENLEQTKWQQHQDLYSNSLIYAATEYECQGLELDMALIEWGDDLFYQDGGWHHKRNTYKECDKYAQNPKQLIQNTYRVLLTRGRDATIVFTQNSNLQQLFIQCGVTKLAAEPD